jgi:hypothetical protein
MIGLAKEGNMKSVTFSALVMAICLCFSPIAGAQSRPGDNERTDGTEYPQGAPPSSTQAVPPELTLPAGTIITVRTTEPLSSDKNRAGDAFSSTLEQPLVAQGWVVARIGQVVQGTVVTAQPASRGKGNSQLGLELSELALVDGSQVPVRTELVRSSAGGSSAARNAGVVGATTGTGAAIGGIAGGGEGAAIGAAIGAAAGIVGILSTPGRATEIAPETVLTFRLQDPVTINTQQSRMAFQPVTQQDYNRSPQRNGPRYRNAESYPPPEPYPYPYYYYPYYWGYYPYYWGGFYAPFGYYGYYGYGPRIYVRPRGYVGRGFGGHRR